MASTWMLTRKVERPLGVAADAVHPGYGFLAENADFAAACSAVCTFVGPSADAIRAMGSKIEAKRIVAAAGTPVVPGYLGDQDPTKLAAAAEEIGYPLLIKASAGGGGKGMRVVRATREFANALAAARRESKAAFGGLRGESGGDIGSDAGEVDNQRAGRCVVEYSVLPGEHGLHVG